MVRVPTRTATAPGVEGDVPLDCASWAPPDWLAPDCPLLGEGEAQMSGVAVGLGAPEDTAPSSAEGAWGSAGA